MPPDCHNWPLSKLRPLNKNWPKTWQNKAHSSCCHLQSPAVLLSRYPSCVWTNLRQHLSCTDRDSYTHTGRHISLPHRMNERQQARQTWHRLGSVEGYARSCQKLNLGSAPSQFFPPQQFKMEKRRVISCGHFVALYSQCLGMILWTDMEMTHNPEDDSQFPNKDEGGGRKRDRAV